MTIEESLETEKKPMDGLIGILDEYSDTELIKSEEDAWAKAVEEKHKVIRNGGLK